MPRVTAHPIPSGSTLASYADQGHYADCFAATVAGEHDLGTFVAAFYTTRLFRSEAWLLGVFAKRPSTKADAHALAQGKVDRFSAWTVEARDPVSLLMCDMGGRTRSWFSVVPGQGATTLLFGSVVTRAADTGKIGWLFNALLPFHKVYARALLWSAARRINP